ncbi:MAG: hypothetical protein LBM96_03105 [Methanobrevibacter sp.]|jgi:hypothetical protein|nr:hypothetical protein [Candidatus Methanoflexus mossambicus]
MKINNKILSIFEMFRMMILRILMVYNVNLSQNLNLIDEEDIMDKYINPSYDFVEFNGDKLTYLRVCIFDE